jgi:hypothetical protein
VVVEADSRTATSEITLHQGFSIFVNVSLTGFSEWIAMFGFHSAAAA